MNADALARHVLPLPATPRSVGQARRFVRTVLAEVGREAWTDSAALAVSELVTNAVLHAHTEVELTVGTGPACVRIEVRDDNPALPVVGNHPDLTAESGRGLLLVSTLADDWGVESTGDGKAVWFELGLQAS